MNEQIVGIDLGSSKICGSVGKISSNGKLQIIGITSVVCSGLNKSVVIDIDSTAEAIKKCITQLERMTDTQINEGYISLPGGICELVRNTGMIAISSEDREIKQSDVDRVIEAAKLISVPPDKEIVGVEPEQYIVDGYDNIKDPRGMSGIRLEVEGQVVMAQSTVVSNLLKSVKRAGIKVNGIVLQPSAISEAVLRKEEKDMGIALVDVGAQTIDISIYKSGKLKHTSIIQLGGDNITNDISVCLKVPFSEGERLKLKYGSLIKEKGENVEKIRVKDSYDNLMEIDNNLLVDIIYARVDELLHLIKRNLVNSGFYNETSGVVIVGGGIALLRGTNELSKVILDKSVRIGSPEYVGAASPIYVTAVGIVLQAVNNIKTSNSSLEESDEHSYDNKWSKNKNIKVENGFASKIKGFFADFF
ncbi:cell division protein FtsA [Clostridium sp. CF011]|uniref:cell division protein FtsA n=1 Tax=Clostridium TaxID=1485 RepID=UPI0013EE6669|nr:MULTISPECIES: cell division protein FtsA [Clostridium]MBU3091944.1 cell division protein FtsA [Clostridium sp. CF011]MBZ9608069.1 cell division protein FtsA [Clostridium estertheticum]WAG70459.1 cell division protein FtsA [Clostridium sp. CF011]